VHTHTFKHTNKQACKLTPPYSLVQTFIVPPYLSTMGFCGYPTFRDAYESMSNPGPQPSSDAVSQGRILTDTYQNPDLVAQQCRPHLVKDLAMLFTLGCVLRIATYVFLAYKGARK